MLNQIFIVAVLFVLCCISFRVCIQLFDMLVDITSLADIRQECPSSFLWEFSLLVLICVVSNVIACWIVVRAKTLHMGVAWLCAAVGVWGSVELWGRECSADSQSLPTLHDMACAYMVTGAVLSAAILAHQNP